ncbi:hypothetical protein E8E11_001401 [Didymella keratinophila]|nr:hypothetical protein E8E11_001401 [Didymella keratinophila]
MPSLPDLPTEIRQQILHLALPDTHRIDFPWPAKITSLFLINKRLFHDMTTVMTTWSPLHYVSFPSSLAPTHNNRTYARKLERICLDLFHASDKHRIQWKCYCQGYEKYTHPELIEAWAAAVPQLPESAKEIYLDITPAPAATRNKHRLYLRKFVYDKCAAKVFLGGHVQDVAALVRRIDKRYGGRVKIGLTGTLSTKSAFFVELVKAWAELDLEFVGEWVSGADARWASLDEAVQRMTSRKLMWQGKKSGDRHAMAWLRDVQWSRKTLFLFARLADEGLEAAAIADVKKIAEFREMQGEPELALEPVTGLQRAFQHCFAAELTLTSAGEGDGDSRDVVVRH